MADVKRRFDEWDTRWFSYYKKRRGVLTPKAKKKPREWTTRSHTGFKPSTCHPDTPHFSKGLCKPCYVYEYKKRNKEKNRQYELIRLYGSLTKKCRDCPAEIPRGRRLTCDDCKHPKRRCRRCSVILVTDRRLWYCDKCVGVEGKRRRAILQASIHNQT